MRFSLALILVLSVISRFAVAQDTASRSSGRRATLDSVRISETLPMAPGERFQPITVLDRAELDRRLQGSIAATIASQPGVTQRFNGPMATQPVIRGLTGDRVLLLEDGLRTGDIATTAPDHSITMDPLSARRVEIIRGPAGLLYGTNTLGGVVNVVREDIPQRRPLQRSISLGAHMESMNRGATLMGSATLPLPGRITFRGSIVGRTSGDSRTPSGPLPFTDAKSADVSAGASWISDQFVVGGAIRDYQAEYGVPSSFGGITLPGSHQGGVYIDLRRTTGRIAATYRPGRVASGLVRSVRVRGNYIRFEQDELERGGFVGTRFGQLAASGDAVVRLAHGRHAGAVGVFHEWRDFRAIGSYTGSRPATLRSNAIVVFDEIRFARFNLLAGARYDRVRLTPLDSTESLLLPSVRTRAFSAFTGTFGATYSVTPSLVVGANVARAFRPPAIEELYSAGPHLASYAYEVGNPQLGAEKGLGADAFVRYSSSRVHAEVAVFDNHIRDFIHYAPVVDSATGLPMRDPRINRYVVYRAAQTHARLYGAEGTVKWYARPNFVADVVASTVRGQRRNGAPLPSMAPDRVRLGVMREMRHGIRQWFIGASGEHMFAQRRVPQAPVVEGSCIPVITDGQADVLPAEYCPTSGVTLLNATAGLRWVAGTVVHGITLSIDNLLDTEWHDPLWRAKQVAPQPGRNVRLLYRVTL